MCKQNFSARHSIIRRSLPDGTIVGGTEASIQSYPYQLSLEKLFYHHCGASIISNDWAVTAAHCVHKVSKRLLRVRAGSSFQGDGGSIHYIDTLISHSQFDIESVDYDIALLKRSEKNNNFRTLFYSQVSSPFVFSDKIQPIRLPTQEEELIEGTMGTVTGWGVTKYGDKVASHFLLQLSLPVMNEQQCNIRYKVFGGVTPRMFCAGYSQGGGDVCQGESGGPLMADGELVGIVSWGVDCGKPEYPGVYTRVSVLRDWIQEYSGV
uniref:Peptidase S1 domain-containing protein n=1 Tax=Timema poppense TaxID=170557 RepID=A0A7R9DF37_TIMPO|nr:unnamed protein product [Timema poppensis]